VSIVGSGIRTICPVLDIRALIPKPIRKKTGYRILPLDDLDSVSVVGGYIPAVRANYLAFLVAGAQESDNIQQLLGRYMSGIACAAARTLTRRGIVVQSLKQLPQGGISRKAESVDAERYPNHTAILHSLYCGAGRVDSLLYDLSKLLYYPETRVLDESEHVGLRDTLKPLTELPAFNDIRTRTAGDAQLSVVTAVRMLTGMVQNDCSSSLDPKDMPAAVEAVTKDATGQTVRNTQSDATARFMEIVVNNMQFDFKHLADAIQAHTKEYALAMEFSGNNESIELHTSNTGDTGDGDTKTENTPNRGDTGDGCLLGSEVEAVASGGDPLPALGCLRTFLTENLKIYPYSVRFTVRPYAMRVFDVFGRVDRLLGEALNRSKHGDGEIVGIDVGDSLINLAGSEYAYTAPSVRPILYNKFMEKQLLNFERRGIGESGRGPIAILVDCSGSMDMSLGADYGGAKRIHLATAFAVALAKHASDWRRSVAIVPFNTNADLGASLILSPNRYISRLKLHAHIMRILAMTANGGTSFCNSIATVQREILNKEFDEFRDADIVFFTDGDGDAYQGMAVRSNLMEGVRIFGLLFREATVSDSDLREIERTNSALFDVCLATTVVNLDWSMERFFERIVAHSFYGDTSAEETDEYMKRWRQ